MRLPITPVEEALWRMGELQVILRVTNRGPEPGKAGPVLELRVDVMRADAEDALASGVERSLGARLRRDVEELLRRHGRSEDRQRLRAWLSGNIRFSTCAFVLSPEEAP